MLRSLFCAIAQTSQRLQIHQAHGIAVDADAKNVVTDNTREVITVGELIWNIPDFSRGLQFNAETVFFLLEIAGYLIGLCFCLIGYKAFAQLVVSAATVVWSGFAFPLVQMYSTGPLHRLFYFTLISFAGMCLAYIVTALISSCLRLLKIQSWLAGCLFVVSPVLGGLIIASDVYFRIYRSLPAAGILLVLTAAVGIIRQYRHKDKRPSTRTYDDIINIKQQYSRY